LFFQLGHIRSRENIRMKSSQVNNSLYFNSKPGISHLRHSFFSRLSAPVKIRRIAAALHLNSSGSLPGKYYHPPAFYGAPEGEAGLCNFFDSERVF
jgi:hypothetical protein